MTPAPFDVPADIVDTLRAICLSLPGAYEEQAWVGTRWCVRRELITESHRLQAAPRRRRG